MKQEVLYIHKFKIDSEDDIKKIIYSKSIDKNDNEVLIQLIRETNSIFDVKIGDIIEIEEEFEYCEK